MARRPVEVVTHAARHPIWRNTLVAIAVVVATAWGVTATVVSQGTPPRSSRHCEPDQTAVSVRPFPVSVTMTSALASVAWAAGPRQRGGSQVSGCVETGDLSPAVPHPDERG